MKKELLLTTIAAGFCVAMNAEPAAETEPKGKAIVQVYGNLHTGFGAENDDRGFELDRSYLGYEYKINDNLQIKGVMDVGKSSDVSDYHRIAYIKNAMITWKQGNFTLSGGLISTTQFNYQEKAWGYRYIMKSFQDQYKYGSSADLGVSVKYKFSDWLSADAIIVNGEGYKKIQINDGLNYGLGVTLTPVKHFNIRLYGGINEGSKSGEKDKVNWAAFMGYKSSAVSAGAEFNYMKHYKYLDDHDCYGYSLYASAKVSGRTDAFVRWDSNYMKDSDDTSRDKSALLLGAQFKLGKYVKVAPNFRMEVPGDSEQSNKYSAYVSCSFGL